MSTSADSGGDDNGGDGRKGYGKRELSTSKRAAQNRAAQRAFRQRKEGYIKKLEEQVRDYALMNENYKAVQAENYQLRDYIINLQSRLIESQGDFPQPPPNVDLPHPSRRQNPDRHEPAPAPPPPARSAHMDYSAINQLRASAAQAGQDLGLGVPSKHGNEESYGSDHLPKRVRNDEGPVDPAVAAQEALQGGGMVIEPRLSHSPQIRDGLSIGSVLNRSTRDVNTSRPLLST